MIDRVSRFLRRRAARLNATTMRGLSGTVLVPPPRQAVQIFPMLFFYLSYPLRSDLGTGNPLPDLLLAWIRFPQTPSNQNVPLEV